MKQFFLLRSEEDGQLHCDSSRLRLRADHHQRPGLPALLPRAPGQVGERREQINPPFFLFLLFLHLTAGCFIHRYRFPFKKCTTWCVLLPRSKKKKKKIKKQLFHSSQHRLVFYLSPCSKLITQLSDCECVWLCVCECVWECPELVLSRRVRMGCNWSREVTIDFVSSHRPFRLRRHPEHFHSSQHTRTHTHTHTHKVIPLPAESEVTL